MVIKIKNITISLGKEYIEKLEIIANKEYSDKTKLIRKWIDENFKELKKEGD